MKLKIRDFILAYQSGNFGVTDKVYATKIGEKTFVCPLVALAVYHQPKEDDQAEEELYQYFASDKLAQILGKPASHIHGFIKGFDRQTISHTKDHPNYSQKNSGKGYRKGRKVRKVLAQVFGKIKDQKLAAEKAEKSRTLDLLVQNNQKQIVEKNNG